MKCIRPAANLETDTRVSTLGHRRRASDRNMITRTLSVTEVGRVGGSTPVELTASDCVVEFRGKLGSAIADKRLYSWPTSRFR